MSCADVQTIQAGNGSKTQFSFDFPYIFKSEIQVSFWNATTKEWDVIAQTDATYPWQVTDANPTIVEFTGTAPPAPTVPVDPNETSVDNVRIRRVTNIDDIRALFNPGSAIRSDDLNKNFEQLRYAIQESNCQGVTDDVYQYLLDNYWDRFDNTIYSADTWVSDDTKVATTESIDQRIDSKIDNALTLDIDGSDGITITDNTPSGGQIVVGIGASSVDLDRIKDEDIITYAEQNAGSPSPADTNIFTASAAARRFDTLIQTSTPSGSDWEVGKTWLQNDDDKTLYMWNGTSWLPVVSGGTFTELSKVIYVDSINGDDTLTGHRISNPKKTIKAAVEDINADPDGDGSVVVVAPGIYGETFPIDIEKNDIAIVGTSLRNCIIHPAIPEEDQAGYSIDTPEPNELETMFRVNSGGYFYGLTLNGMKASGARGGNSLDTDATYGLPTNQGWNFAFLPNAIIRKSPYIQNCTNFSDSRINNVNFTPHTPGEGSAGDLTSAPSGGGILINGATVSSSSPLRSMVTDSYTHTALDGPGIFVTNNGYAQCTSSYAFFNHYHIKCLNGGQANLAASTTDFGRYGLVVDGRSTSAIFTATTTATANDGDITFTIGSPTADPSWHGSATRPQTNMLVDIGGNTYPILSSVANGAGWDVTISRPNPSKRDENLGLDGAVASGSPVSFYLRSMIASSGHTMEYVGSGTDYTALPENGGVPIEANQVVELNDGKVWTATTDHNGKFKVGDFFTVDQRTGFVTVPVGSISFPVLAEDLDVNSHNIFDSTGDVKINDNLDLTNHKIVNVTDPTSAQDAATKNYVDSTFVELTGDTMTGALALPSGTAAAPSLSVGTTDNGIYSPGADQVAISTNGTGRLFVDASGRVGVGTASPGAVLDLRSSASQVARFYADNFYYVETIGNATTSGVVGFNAIAKDSGGASTNFYHINSAGTGQVYVSGNYPLTFHTNSLERLRITSDGKLGLGTSSPATLLHLSSATGSASPTPTELRIATTSNAGDWSTTDPWGRISFYTADASSSGPKIHSTIQATANVANGGYSRLEFGTTASADSNPSVRMVITEGGSVGIGTSSPNALLEVSGTGATNNFYLTSTSNCVARLTASNTSSCFIQMGDPDDTDVGRIIYDNSVNALSFVVNASERARIDSSGRLLVGTSSARTQAGITGQIQLEGTTASTSSIQLIGNSNDSLASFITLGKTRGTAVGATTIVSVNDRLGELRFAGADGNGTQVPGAYITAYVDGTPGASDMPGRLVFSTTADGAASPTERMRIKSTGIVNIANTPTYADNTAALAGGLVAGDIYRKSDGTLMITY